MAIEQCIGCGDNTALGSALYSGRQQLVDSGGKSTFLCDGCEKRLRKRRGRALDEDEAQRLGRDASLFGVWFNPTGH